MDLSLEKVGKMTSASLTNGGRKISEVRSSLLKAVERLSSLQDASNTQGICLNVFHEIS